MQADPSSSSGAESSEPRDRFAKAFFENVSHDLKTPLAVIRAALDQPEADRSEIAQAVRRLHRSIENLLMAARLDAEQLEPRHEWCEPNELIQEAVTSLDHEGHEIRTMVSPSMPFIFVDPAFLDRCVAILVVNAVIHSPARSLVEVEARSGTDFLEFAVRDGGSQLAAGEEAKVFEKFYSGGRRFTDGLLGLWIARQLVQAQGGEIFARNRSEGGVEFSFRLPLGEPMQLPPEAST